MYIFDAQAAVTNVVQWIRDYFKENGGPSTTAVLGISGGKDSTIAAALCKEALGKDRVIGIQLPNGIQSDIADSTAVFTELGIRKYYLNIGSLVRATYDAIYMVEGGEIDLPSVVTTNLPARLRMTLLYSYANCYGARVVCTDNLSETFIGYNTRWGDDVGDFAPLKGFTATEVIQMGRTLCLPCRLVEKTPADGMCGQSDEDRFGFSYEALDKYIRHGAAGIHPQVVEKILQWHERSEYKRKSIPFYNPLT